MTKTIVIRIALGVVLHLWAIGIMCHVHNAYAAEIDRYWYPLKRTSNVPSGAIQTTDGKYIGYTQAGCVQFIRNKGNPHRSDYIVNKRYPVWICISIDKDLDNYDFSKTDHPMKIITLKEVAL